MLVHHVFVEEFRHYLNGIEDAESFNYNPHKWMLTNFDCSAMWVKDRKYLRKALDVHPEYLKNEESNKGLVEDYRNWQLPLGRRFRALKLWFVIRTYGIDGLKEFIRHHIKLAKYFEEQVKKDERFEISVKRMSSLVCFRLKLSKETKNKRNKMNRELLDKINDTGKMFFSINRIKR